MAIQGLAVCHLPHSLPPCCGNLFFLSGSISLPSSLSFIMIRIRLKESYVTVTLNYAKKILLSECVSDYASE